MNNYTDILRQHNLKVTPQRLAITDVLYKRGHISLENLYEVMIKKFNSISLATIYKNINLMLENSFIQEVKIPHAKSVYELVKEEHSHVVCSKCNSIMDISLDTSKILDEASSLSNYNLIESAIVFNGVCPKCLDK